MGQAKRRGPIEQRIAEGVASAEARERERIRAREEREAERMAAWDALTPEQKRRRRETMAGVAMIASLAHKSITGGRF